MDYGLARRATFAAVLAGRRNIRGRSSMNKAELKRKLGR